MTDVCILISTYDKYAPLAELTVELINERWADHPPIFICGITHSINGKVERLLFEGDSRDWIAIVWQATNQLLDQGYRKCYLILDDHPPLGICNDTHLNKTLPCLMDQLNAVYIGLHGWDQNTFSKGVVLDAKNYRLQRQADMFLWRYALHPALWDIQVLSELAGLLIKTTSELSTRSIWSFERLSGALQNEPWGQGRTYRVFGLGMLGGRIIFFRKLLRKIYYMMLKGVFAVSSVLGSNFQEKIENYFIYEMLFYDGPYPLYWSGSMQKGSINRNFEKYLTYHRRYAELERFQNVLALKLREHWD